MQQISYDQNTGKYSCGDILRGDIVKDIQLDCEFTVDRVSGYILQVHRINAKGITHDFTISIDPFDKEYYCEIYHTSKNVYRDLILVAQ